MSLSRFFYKLKQLEYCNICCQLLQTAQHDICSLTSHYEAVQQTGLALKHTADHLGIQSIDDALSRLERLWLDLDSHVRESLRQLDSTIELWDNVEAAMETVLERLKKTRSSLAKPLPVGYDDLEKELRHCQVCNFVDILNLLL